MPFPLVIPLAIATAKVATSYAALYWGGGVMIAAAGGGLLYRWFQQVPISSPLILLHPTEKKISQALQAGQNIQSRLDKCEEQAIEELTKVKLAYAELEGLFAKLTSGLKDAIELEVIIEKIAKIIGEDSKLIERLTQNIVNLDPSSSQTNSWFHRSEQLAIKTMAQNITDSTADLDGLIQGLNPSQGK